MRFPYCAKGFKTNQMEVIGAAIETIYQDFNNQLAVLICRKVNHEDCCHDILQDVYIKVMENIDKVEKADNIKSYLLKIADNAVVDHYRKEANKKNDAFSENFVLPLESPSNDLSLKLADCCLRTMIESLEPIYSEALILTELEGLSQQQYAEKTGISYTNAKTRVQRAREKLRKVILQCCLYEFDKYGNIISCCKGSNTVTCK
jgi:RNA polymerase sigma-70 factor (ECF subfamily)